MLQRIAGVIGVGSGGALEAKVKELAASSLLPKKRDLTRETFDEIWTGRLRPRPPIYVRTYHRRGTKAPSSTAKKWAKIDAGTVKGPRGWARSWGRRTTVDPDGFDTMTRRQRKAWRTRSAS